MSDNNANASISVKIAAVSAFFNWMGDIMMYPIDTISTRLKASKFEKHNSLSYAWTTIKNEGWSLCRGIQLSFPAAFIPTFVYVTIYDYGMKRISQLIDKYNYDKSTKLIFPFFVSSAAEIMCLFFYLPIDTVRTRVQMNRPNDNYTGLLTALRDIKNRQGISRFYKSSKIYFACKTLQTAIQFQSFEVIRYLVGPSAMWMIINTIFSTALATTILNPLEVLITRYALVDTTKKKLVFSHIVSRIYKREGIQGFYKGYETELIHHVVYALCWLPLYQVVREHFGVQMHE